MTLFSLPRGRWLPRGGETGLLPGVARLTGPRATVTTRATGPAERGAPARAGCAGRASCGGPIPKFRRGPIARLRRISVVTVAKVVVMKRSRGASAPMGRRHVSAPR